MIRAFKSTLEDMEEKRSCHSLHSVRSTRSFLSRPTSDVSYVENDEEKWKGKGVIGNNVGSGANGHFASLRGNGSTGQGNAVMTHASRGVAGDNSVNATNYLKVEGGAYRVQRSSSSGSGNMSAQSQTMSDPGGQGHTKVKVMSADASTQSCATSCTQTDESCLAPLVMHAPASPLPPHISPLPYIAGEPGMDHMSRAGSALGPYTRGTSPTPPQYAYGHPTPVTSCYHAAYDPGTAYYHTYLNPMVEAGAPGGLQYDIVVRRPSVGPVPDLSLPPGDLASLHRRPSGGAFLPGHPSSHLMHPHLAPQSLPGSFDSSLPPPLGPGQPLSPRHLGNAHTSTSPIAPPAPLNPEPAPLGQPNQTLPCDQTKPIPLPVPATTTTDIPKLIHETSI